MPVAPHDQKVPSASQAMPGLYVPSLESDSCGTGLIAQLQNQASHQLIEDALLMLRNMEHRGACGAEPNSGDGAGILVQVPHEFFLKVAEKQGFTLPAKGKYGVGMIFFPNDPLLQKRCRYLLADYADELGLKILAYREVPTDHALLGPSSRSVEPCMEQAFLCSQEPLAPDALERKLFVFRKYATHQIHATFPASVDQFYFASLSSKTIVYKGQLTTWQLRPYFPDLQDPDFRSAIALVHSRFSTNTSPKWKLAQPFRMIAHNGEINTITANANWWKSKEDLLEGNLFSPAEMDMLKPVCGVFHSDSALFDNVLEFLVLSGFSLPHALMMMIPEAWQHDQQMPDHKKAFYEFHKTLMEPWDGPASICFTDGILVGATLDRNGLRPSRYCLTDDHRLIVASEVGALPIPPHQVILKGRLQPGRILIADLEEKRLIGDEELKDTICQRLPYRDWLEQERLSLADLPAASARRSELPLLVQQQVFHYTREALNAMLKPMLQVGKDPIGSMGIDTPLAVLSHQAQHFSNYFKQLFAQVTNPPIDPIRERDVMSIFAMLGGNKQTLQLQSQRARFIHLDSPVLTNEALAKLKHLEHDHFKVAILPILFAADGQAGRLQAAVADICGQAEDAVRNGCNILILSQQGVDSNLAPIPSLLATGAIHQHLVRRGLRSQSSLVVECGDAWETHHFATLIGHGASAVNPYLAYASISALQLSDKHLTVRPLRELQTTFDKAIGQGLLKIMSKIGISTLQSYQGSQAFEIVGLNREITSMCFADTISRIEGLGFDDIAREAVECHRRAFQPEFAQAHRLQPGGVLQWNREGEEHLFNPKTIHWLQYSTRKNDYEAFKKYSRLIDTQTEKAICLRALFSFRKGEPIPIEKVESVENILRRFVTGAMSFGSISHEAHATLAIAMNRIGGRSNSGEGGEDTERYVAFANGDSASSATKQVASGRFGVTSYYLSQAKELQIKMAQGAKPGEGGQLPGHKVDEWIGRVRHATPGVGLISPPPHHDIYSIEDLAQLIFDLKNANPTADINVKLVSKAGVGIIASGVAKAHADTILISGHDGGTGASPISSIQHAGLPWELGLAETHQTLVRNKLRDRVRLQTDGQIRSGRDLAIATLLGAEEWGVATAALVVEGCIMMRKCHANTCPVGIATQDPELRARFTGKPEYIVNFFTFLAQELREIMAELGFKTVNEMVGKVERLKVNQAIDHWKYRNLDLRPILYQEMTSEEQGQYKQREQDHGISSVLDHKLIQHARLALEEGQTVKSQFAISNTDRAVGAMLSYEISKRWLNAGLPDSCIQYRFRGSAGQSFGAFGAKGLEFTLEGEANDYFGKGLSGGRLIVVPDRDAPFAAAENIIIGNVAFYGATSGEAYIKGMAGERFCVRNSGVKTVVEGIGDHGCEYMTGGLVVVLGQIGKNFAAGMSGGMAYIYDEQQNLQKNLNPSMVLLEKLKKRDVKILRRMLRNHFTYTGSKKSLFLLQNWASCQSSFVKVMPKDYKIALEKKQAKPEFHIKQAVVD